MFLSSSTLPPVVYDTDPREYHTETKLERGDPKFVMSRSALWDFFELECPLAWRLGGKRETSKAMVWGDLVDCLWLTPDRFERDFAVTPETYATDGMECPKCKTVTDAATCRNCKEKRVKIAVDAPWNWKSTTCTEWRDAREAEGLKVVMLETVSNAWKAVSNLREHPRISAFHAASRKQVALNVEWHDEATGLVIPVHCLLDMVPDPASDFGDTLADFKTTGFMRYRDWCRRIHKDGLDFQAAFYVDAANAALSEPGDPSYKFEHHIQSSSAPWLATYRMMSPDFITVGRNRYQQAFVEYCQCVKDNMWRSYDCAMSEPESYMLA